MGKIKTVGSGSPVKGGRRPSAAGEPEPARKQKRFWAQHKVEAVLRLLRGEDLELLSRELGVPASSLSEWQEIFLAQGAEGFKKRSSKDDLENRRLKEMVGEQAMTIELLQEKLIRVQSPRPLARRRSRK
ncbi:MAG: helix-turn-helix domain-containing protein [Desulfobacterium sp.]|nr:helix-turn-helix domain-containing protein [Desulfobacterium sp.]